MSSWDHRNITVVPEKKPICVQYRARRPLNDPGSGVRDFVFRFCQSFTSKFPFSLPLPFPFPLPLTFRSRLKRSFCIYPINNHGEHDKSCMVLNSLTLLLRLVRTSRTPVLQGLVDDCKGRSSSPADRLSDLPVLATSTPLASRDGEQVSPREAKYCKRQVSGHIKVYWIRLCDFERLVMDNRLYSSR